MIVPPPPEKQAVGRFNDNFVEARRAALEKMLNKIAAHPTLQLDSDLKIFLESGSFAVDVKNRENRDVLETTQRKGMLSAFGLGRGAETKFVEPDEVSFSSSFPLPLPYPSVLRVPRVLTSLILYFSGSVNAKNT